MSRLHQALNNDVVLTTRENALNRILKNARPTRPVQPVSQRERQPQPVDIRKRDRSQNRAPMQTSQQIAIPRQIPKQVATIMKIEEPKRKPSNEMVHKEVFNNNMATVEVTVRTLAPKDGEDQHSHMPALQDRETWGKILAPRRSEEFVQCNFGNFDPLHTLHFLSKELQMKLQSVCPGDPSVGEIVHDMQNVMQRIRPDVLQQLYIPDHFPNTNGDNEPPTNMKKLNEMNNASKSVQTVIIGDIETKKMQQQLEDSAMKLEASCKEMESVCSKLRSERDDLETMLLAERETVVKLKKSLEDTVAEREEKIQKETNKLSEERDLLKNQIKELKTALETQSGQNAEDLRNLVDDLRSKTLLAEQENTSRRNEITMMKLERDKMSVLLDCRDKQLKELRSELECIQQLVSTQLMEFKVKPSFSTASTLSSASQLWNSPSTAKTHKGKSIHELFLNNDVMRKMVLNKDLQAVESGTITTLNADDLFKEQGMILEDIQEIPQRDKSMAKMQESQMTFSDTETINTEYCMKPSNTPSIRDMFAEIKRQAFKSIELQSPTPKTKSTVTTERNSGNSPDGESHTSLSS